MEEREVKRVALFTTTLSSFLTPLSLSALNVALPSIGRTFSLNAIELSYIAFFYLLSSSIFLLPFGKIADIYGRKRVFLYGNLIFTISSLFLAISKSYPFLLIFRVIQGFGGAMIFGTAVAILSSVFKEGERGKVLGINVAAVYLGLSFGPFIGGFLTYYFGWRSIFLLNVPFGLIILLFTFQKLKIDWAKKEPFDYRGTILYVFAIFLLTYGFSLLPKKSGFFAILFGVLSLIFFVFAEKGKSHPLLELTLFSSNRLFLFSNISALINYSATFATAFLLSLYLQHIRSLSPKEAGFVLVLQPFVQAILSPFAGRLSDKVESRIIASLGMGLTALGLFLFFFLDFSSSFYFVLFVLFVLGFGFGLFSSPNTNAIMSSVGKEYYGLASSIIATMRLLGQMFSMAIATMMFSFFMGDRELIPSNYPFLLESIKNTFLISSILCFFGIFTSLSRGGSKTRRYLN